MIYVFWGLGGLLLFTPTALLLVWVRSNTDKQAAKEGWSIVVIDDPYTGPPSPEQKQATVAAYEELREAHPDIFPGGPPVAIFHDKELFGQEWRNL